MQQLVKDIAATLQAIDRSGIPFKSFKPGVGPYGEPQLVKLITENLRTKNGERYKGAETHRTPDVLIPGSWALEFKIVRPFGDNGIEAEHWSQNLLHPYKGNVSAIGDVMKLCGLECTEQKGIVVISYEHEPPKIDVAILVRAFEIICRELLRLPLGKQHCALVTNCIHPVHQRATVFGWPLVQQKDPVAFTI